MLRSHKIQLKPTKKQIEYFIQACGTSRFVWNWALAEWDKRYKIGEQTSGMELRKYFNKIKYEQYPWLKQIHRDAHSRPFDNLQKAYSGFFKKKSAKPKFKKRGKCKDSFYVANDKFSLSWNKTVKLPVIGVIKMTEELKFDGKMMGATVSRSADRWFISIQVELEDEIKPRNVDLQIGIDVGVKTSVTCSDGIIYQSPKPLYNKLKLLRRLSRICSRKVKGSNNKRKANQKLAKLHWRISNVRKDFIHKTTTDIVRKSQAIAIEDLSVKDMMSNHKLARGISEQGFYELRRQLEYKSGDYGTELVIVDKYFPSSKTCSSCNFVKPVLMLSERVFKCECCGLEIDRDFNASLNLKSKLPSARGEVKPVDHRTVVGGMKQESSKLTCG